VPENLIGSFLELAKEIEIKNYEAALTTHLKLTTMNPGEGLTSALVGIKRLIQLVRDYPS